jgi:hypothetical protein
VLAKLFTSAILVATVLTLPIEPPTKFTLTISVPTVPMLSDPNKSVATVPIVLEPVKFVATAVTSEILFPTFDIASVAVVPSSMSAKFCMSVDNPATKPMSVPSFATVVMSPEIEATVVTSVAFGDNL